MGFSIKTRTADIAEAALQRKAPGQMLAGFASFVKTNGEWRIESM